MIDLSRDPVVTDALRQWRSREVFPTDFGSADLRGLSRELRMRAIFSAHTTNAHYLEEIGHVVDDIVSGKINMAEGRLRLMKKLTELGYDPAKGFPSDMANVPPAEKDSLQDLGSYDRLQLVLETNVRKASSYGQAIAGNTEYARREYPAWELVRRYSRHTPRGTPESHTAGWPERWAAAGNSVGWQGALSTPMIALKDSPIWKAIGDGAGDYLDALGDPYPPFAFGSGYGWRAVDRARCEKLGLIGAQTPPPAPVAVTLAPPPSAIAKVYAKMAPDLKAQLAADFAALGI